LVVVQGLLVSQGVGIQPAKRLTRVVRWRSECESEQEGLDVESGYLHAIRSA